MDEQKPFALDYHRTEARQIFSPEFSAQYLRFHYVFGWAAVTIVFLLSAGLQPMWLLLMGMALLISFLFSLLMALGATMALVRCGRTSIRRPVVLNLLILAAVISIGLLQWPLRLRYALSAGAMDRLATTVAAGTIPTTPTYAGLIRVEKIEIRGTDVCLWTAYYPGGPHGFVRTAPGAVPQVNIGYDLKLNARWHFVEED